MTEVHLRPVMLTNYRECLRLRVATAQEEYVASNAQSLAEAYVNPTLVPLAIYDVAARGYEDPPVPMVGFTMYELAAGVGFITRLMIGMEFQGKGYGRAAMQEVIRRLWLCPTVEIVATSHRRGNEGAAKLYADLGFVPWDVGYATPDNEEVFLRLP